MERVRVKRPEFKRYGAIEKVITNDDGTVDVFGIASTEQVDNDGEVILSSAMEAALPDYMKWGAVREMHQPKAAGTALEASVDADTKQTMIGVHVVDPIAVKKVREGVYKGFSIGGKVTKRNADDPNIIEAITWIETSLVDRPSNPGAEILIVKADMLTDDTQAATGWPTAAARGWKKPTTTKGMYDVQTFADVLQRVSYLVQNAAAEAGWEGDNSTVPDKLRAWVDAGAAIFKDMAEEEVTELLQALQPDTGEQKMANATLEKGGKGAAKLGKAAAAHAAEVAKMAKAAGAHFELCAKMADEVSGAKDAVAKAATPDAAADIVEKAKATLGKLHKSLELHKDDMAECAKAAGIVADHAQKLADEPDGDEDKAKAAGADDLQKVADVSTARDDALAKAAALEGELQKVAGERDDALAKATALQASIVKIEGEVQTMVDSLMAKGAIFAVGKIEDMGKLKPEDEVVDTSDPTAAFKLLKKVHSAGGRPLMPLSRG